MLGDWLAGMRCRDDLAAALRDRGSLSVGEAFVTPAGHVIALVKPQFEAGRREVGKGGIIRDPAVHARVVDEVTRAALAVGLERLGLEPSPIEGAEGNREFLIHLRLQEKKG